ncbi:hypothetical protein [Inquilinus sp. CAU 1745]|uniref:hypothetical protein n=1 Tax=Inquilinus sp. CAU 1745 TaxID=3140369 RepID=UPI00325AAD1E
MGLIKTATNPGGALALRPALDPSAAILAFDYKTPRLQVWLGLLLGPAAIAVAIVAYRMMDDPFFRILFPVVGGLVGLVFLIRGIFSFRFAKSFLITGSMIIVKTQTLFGRDDWQEPIANYRGVTLRVQKITHRHQDRASVTITYHVVELTHPQGGKTIPLYVQKEGKPPVDRHRAFAERFELPAMEPA